MNTDKDIPKVARTEFDRWLWERDIDNVKAGKLFGRHPMTIGRWRKPFGDPERRTPGEDDLAVIARVTNGEIGAVHFYPPEIAGVPSEASTPSEAA